LGVRKTYKLTQIIYPAGNSSPLSLAALPLEVGLQCMAIFSGSREGRYNGKLLLYPPSVRLW